MTYAIGDIHGCQRSFQALLGRLQLTVADELVLLGDYIDRGPDSKGVIDTILNLRESGHQIICLRGNHEQLLINARTSAEELSLWLRNGGRETLASFSIDRLQDIPESYLVFMHSTQIWYGKANFLFVHGGLDFSSPDPLGDPHSILWLRNWYPNIDYAWLGNRIVIHGHTPLDMEPIRTQLENLDRQRYLNLDNGCVYAGLAKAQGRTLGHLLAFCLETRELFVQENVG